MNKIFKNKYNEVRSGWVILSGILFFFLTSILITLIFKSQSEEIKELAANIGKIFNSIALIYILSIFHKRRPMFSMGFSKYKWLQNMVYGVVFGFVSISLVFIVMLLFKGIRFETINFSNAFTYYVFSMFICYLTVGLIEETLFRAYIMTALQTTRSKIAIVFISSVLFSLLHLGNAGVNIIAIINIIFMGILFTYMFVKSGSVWLPIGFHFAWDFFEIAFYGFTSNGVTGSNTIIKLSYMGKDFITGGSFGPEAGIIVTLSLIFILAWTYFFVKKLKTKEVWTLDDNPSNYSK